MNLHVHTETYMWMTVLALFIIAKTGTTQISINSRMDKKQLWYIHIMECYSAIKKEEITDTYVNVDEFQKHYVEQKDPDPQKKCTVWFYLYEVQVPANWSIMISIRTVVILGGGEQFHWKRNMSELSGMICVFSICIWVVVTQCIHMKNWLRCSLKSEKG